MSADVWLVVDTGGSEHRRIGCDYNVTYNLTWMLREAGFCGWRDLVGQNAADSLPMLRSTLQALLDDPARFKALNPANGWGDYDGLVAELRSMIAGAEDNPLTTWDGWL